ncbi:Maf family protein [Porcipelethomonas sp.]|uniref:Maf family protein n=1 Tax=Porcipelethomonas sp. TaxID=2981675 RepID=UPI003EF80CCE
MKIVLASSSPRRKELLKLLFDDFSVKPSGAAENIPDEIKADTVAEYLAVKKAESIIRETDELVIGCDTSVVIDNTILGKPDNEQECRKMLSLLSGKIHQVYTGVCIIYKNNRISFTEKTDVEFYELTGDEIESYIQTGEPFDKAGGYGIQGRGALLIKSISGDYFNVVGLPVSRLNRELKKIF